MPASPLSLTLALLVSAAAVAAETKLPEISVETDPSTFLFSGYAAHLRIRLPECESLRAWTLGVGTYGMDFPSVFRDMAIKDAPTGSELTLVNGTGVFIDRFLGEPGQGWFAGVQIAYQRYHLSDAQAAETYDALLLMPRIGYQWELGHGFYALPWAGIGYVDPHGDSGQLGTQSYAVRQVLPFATVHLGYRF